MKKNCRTTRLECNVYEFTHQNLHFPSVLASSLVFNLADGQFSSRADLIDAPGSSLGRGAQVAGLGELCFSYILMVYSELTDDSTLPK